MATPLELLPRIAQVKRVPERVIHRYEDSQFLIDVLKDLDMGLFTDPSGDYWIGSDDPKLPHHDRWFYMLKQADVVTRDAWSITTYRVVFCCTPGDAFSVIEYGDVVDALDDRLQVKKQMLQLRGKKIEDAQTLSHNFFMALQAFENIGPEQLATVIDARWGQDLHDILRHYGEWAIRNPEARELPRDLVLRMYGLGAYVNARDLGDDWLV